MPAFALDLDPDGIRLLFREADVWRVVGRVGLDDPDLRKRLRDLKTRAEALSDGPLETELIIPPGQILYTSVTAPAGSNRLRDEDIAAALEGLTSCPVEEMRFDWKREGDEVRVAALDVNTLDEAESFAATYGFNPVRFTARPGPGEFPVDPDFGPTERARQSADEPDAPVFASRREAAPQPVVPAPAPAPAAEKPAPEAAPPEPAAPLPRAAANQPRAGRMPSGPFLMAAAALLAIAGLVWTALYLVTPRFSTSLPEVAETPEVEAEDVVEEPRLVPRRSAPVLSDHAALPAMPGALDVPDVLTAMADRQMLPLYAPTAPDPETEVGILRSADMWQTPPPPLIEPTTSGVDTLYLAAVDPVVVVDDAFALAPPSERHATAIAPPLPPQPGEVYELDERGLVVATPEGALTPEGVVVTAGAPPLRPPLRPTTAIIVPNPELALALAGKQPKPRPRDLAERTERVLFGGRTLAELGDLRPKPRPASAQQAAVSAEDDGPPSKLAVEVSRAPSYRPTDFAAIVAAAQQARKLAPETDTAVVAAAAAVVAPVQPTIPSSASVARQATIEDAINLRRLNLIGVYGSASDRRALIRLPSGRYVKVKVGDRIDGGQVAAIGDGELRYVKGGKNHTLTVPSG